MKKVIFGGFCLLSGILILLFTADLNSVLFGGDPVGLVAKLLGTALAIYGFYLGILGLKSED